MDTECNVIPQIASDYAGEIGNTAAVCGAVVGAVMVIGLKQGRADTMGEALGTLVVAREFRHRFEAEMESINCRELTVADLTSEERLEQFINSETPKRSAFRRRAQHTGL